MAKKWQNIARNSHKLNLPLSFRRDQRTRRIHCPFHPHQKCQITKHAGQENYLWNELGENIQGSLEIGGVPVGQANSKSHVDNSKNNGNLVLDGIQDLNFTLEKAVKGLGNYDIIATLD